MKYLLPLLLLFISSKYCKAQTSLPADLRFNFLDVKGGLPEGFVFSMIQDRQGYIWMTTQRGLVRYDGYKPKIYTLGITDPYRMFVVKVYQDRKGRIWAGTFYGDLYLYNPDNDNFIHYPLISADSGPAPDLIVSRIEEDSLGRLWITMANQVLQQSSFILFDPASEKITHYGRQETGKNHIDAGSSTLYQSQTGHTWVSGSKGLYRFDYNKKQFINQLPAKDTAKQNEFVDVIEDVFQPGLLWFTNAFYIIGAAGTTKNGLRQVDTRTGTLRTFYHQPGETNSIASDTILKVMNDAKKNLWVGTMSGLSLFDRENNKFINYYPAEKKSGDRNAVIDMVEDKTGNFWCQTGMGILFFDIQTRKFTRIAANPKKADGLISNNLLHTLLLDKRGTLWLGVGSSGVQWINRQPSGFIQYNINQDGPLHFPGGEVQGFAKDAEGNIWIGSRRGLYQWQVQTNSFTKIKFWKDKTISESSAGVPLVDKNGKIWFAANWSNDDGLNCYDPRTGKMQYYRNIKNDTTSLSDNNVMKLCQDHAGNIWVGTLGNGICKLDPTTQKFTRYPFIRNTGTKIQNFGALNDNWVLSMLEDKARNIWVGTNSGGLSKFNAESGSFTTYQNIVPGFESITGIYEDSQNQLWVGSYYGGVFLFDRETGKAEKFTEKDGLLYDGANAILEDSSHNLWLTSARGISIFNTQTHQVRALTTATGLPFNNVNNFIYGIKISNRQFLFSGDNGFTVIDPEEFKPDPNAPMVHIESVGFNIPGSKPTRDSIIFAVDQKEISLAYNENRLNFAYVGLHYQQADLVQYAYQLEGYDKEWIAAGTQRTVRYINLSPGTYTFRVKAANASGVWSTEIPSLTITIHPPWWQRWWAWLIYAVLTIAALWAFIAYRARNLKRANLILEEKVSHRTAQLNKSLDNLRDTQKQLIQSEKMASLGELTAGIAHEIQNPLNFVTNFSEVNNELIEEVKSEKSKLKSEELDSLLTDIFHNNEKINYHGKRADAIVKGMLQHSRSSTGQKEPTDINALADEYLRLSYHGLRAKDSSFNAIIKTDFDQSIGKVNIVQQDIGRVLLNLYNNAFYAAGTAALPPSKGVLSDKERFSEADSDHTPTVRVSTKKEGDKVLIFVSDNGQGIPAAIIDKIFQPFFTTKPTGQGTGLGLSLSYDIVKAHGGQIRVETKEGEIRPDDKFGRGTVFTIELPL